MHKSVINLIGRHRPQIFDILGNPEIHKGKARRFATPQQQAAAAGFLVARELVRTAVTAQRLRLDLRYEIEDFCPPPRFPPIPWPPGPWPWPGPWPGPDPRERGNWEIDYALGLVLGLEHGSPGWEHLSGAEELSKLHEAAFSFAQERIG